MVDKWRTTSIGRLCDDGIAELQTGPFGTQLHAHDYVDDGVSVVPTEAIRNRQIDHSVLPKISRSKAEELARHKLKIGDILFARRGVQATGHIGCVREAEEGFICGTGAIRLRVKRVGGAEDVCPDFLSHVLANPASISWFKFHAIGATMPNLNEGIIRSFPLRIPAHKEQRAIAHILGTLDDKIELNRRRNETLEAMARALFQDWFVDFGPVRAKMEGRGSYLPADLWQLLPDKLSDEGMPVGWRTAELDGIAALVTNSVSPGKSPETIFAHYSIPAFDAGRMPAMELGGSIKSNKYIVDGDAVLVSKLNPQTPRVWLPSVTTDRAICSTEFMQFVPLDSKNRPYLYCLMASQAMQEVIQQHVTGSTGSRQRAQPTQIAKVDVLVPPPDVLMVFNRQAASILSAVLANQRESQTLAQLRDTLLPKLISGELRIKDAERFMEERAA